MKKDLLKKSVPYLAAIAIFIVITFIFYSPLLEGQKLFQSDIAHFSGGAKEIIDYREQTGKEPLWTNSMFGGMPAYQISTVYTGNLLGFFDKIFTLGLPRPADMLFLYFIGFFFLLITLRVNPWLAVAGAIGYAFSSYFLIIIEVGHNSKADAIGYMAPVLAGIILTFRKKYFLGGILTTLFLSLQIKSNHPQISYYLIMMAFVLGACELVNAFRNKEYMPFLKSAGILIIAGLLAVLTNVNTLWPTYEYSKDTIRGKSELSTEKENRTSGLDKDYATQWSYGIGETMTLLIPNAYGGSYQNLDMNSATAKALRANNVPDASISQFLDQPMPMYWGKQPFTSGPVYVGAVIFFLFILGLFIVKGPVKWWLLAVTVLSIMLAWGHNFMAFTDFFFQYVPGYNKFRAVTMTLVIAELAMPLLGILAVRELLEPGRDPKLMTRKLITAFGITGGFTLLLALAPGMFFNFTGAGDAQYGFPDWLLQGLRDDRMRMMRTDAFRSFAFILLSAGILWAMLQGKIRYQYGFLILIGLILADMYPVSRRYVSNDNFTSSGKIENPYEATPADQQILADTAKDYRVLNLTVDFMNDASTSYFHKSVGGYHGAKLRRYQEVVDHSIRAEIQTFARSMSNAATPVLNMLNTRYIIVPDTSKRPVPFRNNYALGNAWFVNEIRMVNNPDEEIKALTDFDPAKTAIVDKRFEGQVKGVTPTRDSADQIRLSEYQPNYLKYQSSSANQGVAVFSEIYYDKGWNAFVDGNPVPHFRVNYLLRAMIVPAGSHTIEFRFEPVVYEKGEMISRISSILVLLLIAGAIAVEVRKSLRKTS